MRIPRRASWRVFLGRFIHLNLALIIFSGGISGMLVANIGVGPWDVLHQGLAEVTGISIGIIMVIVGLLILGASVAFLQVKPGLGTVLNMVMVGLWVDVWIASGLIPVGQQLLDGTIIYVIALLVTSAGTGLYLSAGLGAGPRDGFTLGLARVTGIQVRTARTLLELSALVSGWLMGGKIGLGTVLFAFTSGPLMQLSIRMCTPLERLHQRRANRFIPGGVAAGRGSRP